MVGKYVVLKDAYKSLIEALVHGGVANNVRVNLDWVESEVFEGDRRSRPQSAWRGVCGVLVPGGFGERGAEGKIRAVQFARERGVPYFGICFGMQMAVIEAARNLAGMPDASSTEFGPTPAAGRWADEGVGARERAGEPRGGARPRRLHAARAPTTPC